MMSEESIYQEIYDNKNISDIRYLSKIEIERIDCFINDFKSKIESFESPVLKSAYNLLFTVRKQFKSLLEKTNPNSSVTITRRQANVIYGNCVYALTKATNFIVKKIDFNI